MTRTAVNDDDDSLRRASADLVKLVQELQDKFKKHDDDASLIEQPDDADETDGEANGR